MIDTHCHLYDEAFDADRDEAIARAQQAGVGTLVLPAIDSTNLARQERLAEQYPHLCRQMMGLHPTSVGDTMEEELALVEERLFNPPPETVYVGVGEIGLDLYWDKSHLEQQLEALRRQMEWSRQLGLPVCLHVRKAMNELFGLLRELNWGSYRGVMHCFGGSVQEAHRAVEMGFHIGIGGVVTFKNATLAQVAKAVPLERIVLETDAPYLAPIPHRGHRNESAFLPLVAEKIAELRGISPQEVDETTTASARRLFGLEM